MRRGRGTLRGIVAPAQTYHIHETGFHGTWLEEVVGKVNPRLGGLPPDVVMRSLLFQLRVCANADFRAVMVVSGQNGAQGDLRLVADEFTKIAPVPVVVRSDPELVRGAFTGDHVGRYELSQLLYIRSDLVDMTRLGRVSSDPLGRFAQNPDAHEATAEYGEQITETQIARIGELAHQAGLGHSACRPSRSTTSSPPGQRSSGNDHHGSATARSLADHHFLGVDRRTFADCENQAQALIGEACCSGPSPVSASIGVRPVRFR